MNYGKRELNLNEARSIGCSYTLPPHVSVSAKIIGARERANNAEPRLVHKVREIIKALSRVNSTKSESRDLRSQRGESSACADGGRKKMAVFSYLLQSSARVHAADE